MNHSILHVLRQYREVLVEKSLGTCQNMWKKKREKRYEEHFS